MSAHEWTLVDRLERGYAMRVERAIEAALLISSFFFDTLVPVYLVLVLFLLQVIWPVMSPFALMWLLFERRVPPARLGNLYFDVAGSRGACFVSCLVLGTGLAAMHAGFPVVGRLFLAAPCASCILAPTVGFCAGCGYYVLGRDLMVRAGWISGVPRGSNRCRSCQ